MTSDFPCLYWLIRGDPTVTSLPILMKILFYLLSLILLLALAIIPYWSGKTARQQLEQLEIPFVKLSDIQHQSQTGWLNSQAKTSLILKQLLQRPLANNYQITLQHHIRHGLLPLKPLEIDSILTTIPDLRLQLEQFPNNTDLLTIHTIFPATGQLTHHLTIPKFTYSHDTWRASWQGLQGQAKVSTERALTGIFHIPNIKISRKSQELNLQYIDFTLDFHDEQFQTTLKLNDLNWQHSPQNIWQATTVQIAGKGELQEEMLFLHIQPNLAHLTMGTETYQNLSAQLILGHLHQDSVLQILQLLLNNSFPLNWMALGQLMQITSQLFTHHPELQISQLDLTTSAGKIQGNLQVKVAEFDPITLLLQPQLFWQILSGNMDLQMPRAIFQMWLSPETIKYWIDQGILEQQSEQVFLITGTQFHGKLTLF